MAPTTKPQRIPLHCPLKETRRFDCPKTPFQSLKIDPLRVHLVRSRPISHLSLWCVPGLTAGHKRKFYANLRFAFFSVKPKPAPSSKDEELRLMMDRVVGGRFWTRHKGQLSPARARSVWWTIPAWFMVHQKWQRRSHPKHSYSWGFWRGSSNADRNDLLKVLRSVFNRNSA